MVLRTDFGEETASQREAEFREKTSWEEAGSPRPLRIGGCTAAGAKVGGEPQTWVPSRRSDWWDLADLGSGRGLLEVGTVQATGAGNAEAMAEQLRVTLRRLAVEQVAVGELLDAAEGLCTARGGLEVDIILAVVEGTSGLLEVASAGRGLGFVVFRDPPTWARQLPAPETGALGTQPRATTPRTVARSRIPDGGWLVLCSRGLSVDAAAGSLAIQVLGAARCDPSRCCHELLGSHLVTQAPATVVAAKWSGKTAAHAVAK